MSPFGTEAAWGAAQELANAIYESLGDSTREYEEKHEDVFLRRWQNVIEAMRPDAAPAEPRARSRGA